MATLALPVVLAFSALWPMATLRLPVVRLGITVRPNPTLATPVKVPLNSVSPAAALPLLSK